jgi:hypothetical protein
MHPNRAFALEDPEAMLNFARDRVGEAIEGLTGNG